MRRPGTLPGWWAVGLITAFFALLLINLPNILNSSATQPAWVQIAIPIYEIANLLCGLGALVLGWFAILRRGERSWLVFLSILPGLILIVFLLGELILPH